MKYDKCLGLTPGTRCPVAQLDSGSLDRRHLYCPPDSFHLHQHLPPVTQQRPPGRWGPGHRGRGGAGPPPAQVQQTHPSSLLSTLARGPLFASHWENWDSPCTLPLDPPRPHFPNLISHQVQFMCEIPLCPPGTYPESGPLLPLGLPPSPCYSLHPSPHHPALRWMESLQKLTQQKQKQQNTTATGSLSPRAVTSTPLPSTDNRKVSPTCSTGIFSYV